MLIFHPSIYPLVNVRSRLLSLTRFFFVEFGVSSRSGSFLLASRGMHRGIHRIWVRHRHKLRLFGCSVSQSNEDVRGSLGSRMSWSETVDRNTDAGCVAVRP